MKFIPRKRFGQHFLKDPAVIEKIIESAQPLKTDHFFEIGPGMGALTQPLLERVQRLSALEIDRDLVKHLQSSLGQYPHLNLLEGDALTFNFGTLVDPVRIISNLPYNISTPLLFRLFKYANKILDLTLMLQKEVVMRLQASPGSKDYGRLSVMAQYHCQIGASWFVDRQAFKPPPEVDSMVIGLTPYRVIPDPALEYDVFSDLVRTAFSQRRKQLKNNLTKLISAEDLYSIGITPSLRPEEVTLSEYVKISNSLSDYHRN